MTTIRAAVEALRTSREAATSGQWHWVPMPGEIRNALVSDGEGGIVIPSANVRPADANLIALVASPHVVQALEELLDAIEQHTTTDEPHGTDCLAWIAEKARDFADELTRRTP